MTEEEIFYKYGKAENKYDYIDTIEKLEKIENLIGVNNFYINGEHILFKLIADKKDNFVKYFLNKEVNLRIINKNTYLYSCLINSEYFEYCIEKNLIKADECYGCPEQIIFTYIINKNFDIVKLFLNQDFDINILYDKFNILYYLIYFNHKNIKVIELIKIVINKGINLNHDNKRTVYNTILAYVVGIEWEEITELLLTSGANTEIINYKGNTPLLRSIKNNNMSINNLELLLKFGANVNMVDFDNKTVLDVILVKDDKKEWIDLLYKFGAKTFEQLQKKYLLLPKELQEIIYKIKFEEERKIKVNQYIKDLIKFSLEI
jgi:hypothetical protein